MSDRQEHTMMGFGAVKTDQVHKTTCFCKKSEFEKIINMQLSSVGQAELSWSAEIMQQLEEKYLKEVEKKIILQLEENNLKAVENK